MDEMPKEELLPCCDICKHCFYTGLPGAYACEMKPSPAFVDLFDYCSDFEKAEDVND